MSNKLINYIIGVLFSIIMLPAFSDDLSYDNMNDFYADIEVFEPVNAVNLSNKNNLKKISTSITSITSSAVEGASNISTTLLSSTGSGTLPKMTSSIGKLSLRILSLLNLLI